MVSDTHLRNIGLIMVREGLLQRDAFERAVDRKKRSGGSLALNLVLEGTIDEIKLVEFYAKRYGLTLAAEAMLAGIDRTVFSLIPLEICYDSGILPLYLKDQETLVVGLVDPTDRELLMEAAFFSGYNLEPRLVTVSQMAIHFSRLANQPWKIDLPDAESLREGACRGRRLDDEIEELLAQTAALDNHVDQALAESLDVTYGPASTYTDETDTDQEESPTTIPESQGPSIWVLEEAARSISQIRIVAPGPGAVPTIVEAQDVAHAVVQPATTSAGGSPVQPAEPTHGFKRIPTRPILGALPPEPDAATFRDKPPAVVEGEAITKTGPVKVLGVDLDRLGDTQKSIPVPHFPVAVVSDSTSEADRRPHIAVPALPARQPEWRRLTARFFSLGDLIDTLGAPDAGLQSAIHTVRLAMRSSHQRDELGEALVNGLALHYQTIAVMTLNGPRAVVWRCLFKRALAPDLVGKTIEMEAGDILHRVSEEGVFFWGPLPVRSRLGEALQVEHNHPVLLAPVQLRGRTILLVYLDAGREDFPSPGEDLEHLLVEMSSGLERVILLRRHSRHKN